MQNDFINVTITKESVKFFIPFESRHKISLFDIKGRNILSFSGHNKWWYNVPAVSFSEGLYVLLVKSNNRAVSRKFLFVD